MTSPINGPTEKDIAHKETSDVSLRAELMKKLAFGGGSTFGLAIVFGAFELLHNDSKDAFPLLKSWGPWAILSMLVAFIAYDLAKMALKMLLRLVIAIEALADAQNRSADKDDRQIQDLQTLTAFSAQESERNSEKLGALMDLVKTMVERRDSDRAVSVAMEKKLDAVLSAVGGKA